MLLRNLVFAVGRYRAHDGSNNMDDSDVGRLRDVGQWSHFSVLKVFRHRLHKTERGRNGKEVGNRDGYHGMGGRNREEVGEMWK